MSNKSFPALQRLHLSASASLDDASHQAAMAIAVRRNGRRPTSSSMVAGAPPHASVQFGFHMVFVLLLWICDKLKKHVSAIPIFRLNLG
jgi:hypothetical protein